MGASARGMVREIQSRQRLEYQYHVAVTGDVATPTLSGDAEQLTIARNSIGNYTITLNPGAGRACLAQVTGRESDTVGATLASTTTTVQIEIRTAGALADSDVWVLITARDSVDET